MLKLLQLQRLLGMPTGGAWGGTGLRPDPRRERDLAKRDEAQKGPAGDTLTRSAVSPTCVLEALLQIFNKLQNVFAANLSTGHRSLKPTEYLLKSYDEGE